MSVQQLVPSRDQGMVGKLTLQLDQANQQLASVKVANGQLKRDLERTLAQLAAEQTRARTFETQTEMVGQANERLRKQNTDLSRRNTALTEELKQTKEHAQRLWASYDILNGKMIQLNTMLGRLGVGPSTPPSALPFTFTPDTKGKDPNDTITDGDLKRKRPYSERKRNGKKVGGQKGHKPSNVKPRKADKTVTYEPKGNCENCGNRLCDGELLSTVTYQSVTVHTYTRVTDHVYNTRSCCNRKHKKPRPKAISVPVYYTNAAKAFALGLCTVGPIPFDATTKVMAGLTGLKVSAGSVAEWHRQLAGKLQGFDKVCVAVLNSSPAVNADETSIKTMDGTGLKTFYAHVAATPEITRFHLGSRSMDSIKAGNVVGQFEGVLISDCYSSYFALHKFKHQLCLAHLIRECEWWDCNHTKPNAHAQVPDFAAILTLFQDAIHARNEHPGLVLDYSEFASELNKLVINGLELMKGDTRKVANSPRSLLERLQTHHGKLWVFLANPAVPPTNNTAERPIRPLKVKLKRTGRFRTLQGAKDYLLIASYISTCTKNGIEPVDAISRALEDNPYLPPQHI